jgi:FlaG/FlaF family flagellin (archaellin)
MSEALRRDRRGVSKVVGVVLLVGITVLLVAGTATVTTGIAGETPTQEQVDVQQSAFSFEYTNNVTWDPASDTDGEGALGYDGYLIDELTISYQGGSVLSAENIFIEMTGDGTGFKCINNSNELSCGATHDSRESMAYVSGSSRLIAGDSVQIITILDDIYENDGRPVSAEMDSVTVRLVWESGSGESTTLAEWEGPEA